MTLDGGFSTVEYHLTYWYEICACIKKMKGLTDLHIAIFDSKSRRTPESWLLNPLVDISIHDFVARGGKCVVELRSDRDRDALDEGGDNTDLSSRIFNEVEGQKPFKNLPFTIERRAPAFEGHQLTPAVLHSNTGIAQGGRRGPNPVVLVLRSPFRYVYNIGKSVWLRVKQ
jgi:hypothetical protein